MPAPSIPGSFVGQHLDGYFWNGTSWEPGETVGGAPAGGATAEELFRRQAAAPTPAPSTAFGGTVINQQNATPAPVPEPAPAPAAATSAAKRASILATIMRIESGGKNIPQVIDDINMRRGDPAQGYFQIIGDTWREHGGGATGHKSAIDAPYQTQLQVAQNIPIERWGPATQQALKSAGYEPRPGETLGQMLARYNEDPTATRPEDVGGSGAGGTPPAPTLTAGLLTPSTPVDTTAAAAAVEQARKDKEQEQAFADMTKTGTGLLAKATPAPVKFAQAPIDAHIPERKIPPLPNYTKAAAEPDFMQMLMQQRLQRRT